METSLAHSPLHDDMEKDIVNNHKDSLEDNWEIIAEEDVEGADIDATRDDKSLKVSQTVIDFPFLFPSKATRFQENCFEELRKRLLAEMDDNEKSQVESFVLSTIPSNDKSENPRYIKNNEELLNFVDETVQFGHEETKILFNGPSRTFSITLVISPESQSNQHNSEESIPEEVRIEPDLKGEKDVNKQEHEGMEKDKDSSVSESVSDIQRSLEAIAALSTPIAFTQADSEKAQEKSNMGEVNTEDNDKDEDLIMFQEPEKKKLNVTQSNPKNDDEHVEPVSIMHNLDRYPPPPIHETADKSNNVEVHEIEIKQSVAVLNASLAPISTFDIFEPGYAYSQQEPDNLITKESEIWAEKELDDLKELPEKAKSGLKAALSIAFDSDQNVISDEWKFACDISSLINAESPLSNLVMVSFVEEDESSVSAARDASIALKAMSDILVHSPELFPLVSDILSRMVKKLNKQNSLSAAPTEQDYSDQVASVSDDAKENTYEYDNFEDPPTNDQDLFESQNLYSKEIEILVDHGFIDLEKNMEILNEVNGDINEALERLLPGEINYPE